MATVPDSGVLEMLHALGKASDVDRPKSLHVMLLAYC